MSKQLTAHLQLGAGFFADYPLEEPPKFKITLVAPTNDFERKPERWVFELKGHLKDNTFLYVFTGVEA